MEVDGLILCENDDRIDVIVSARDRLDDGGVFDSIDTFSGYAAPCRVLEARGVPCISSSLLPSISEGYGCICR